MPDVADPSNLPPSVLLVLKDLKSKTPARGAGQRRWIRQLAQATLHIAAQPLPWPPGGDWALLGMFWIRLYGAINEVHNEVTRTREWLEPVLNLALGEAHSSGDGQVHLNTLAFKTLLRDQYSLIRELRDAFSGDERVLIWSMRHEHCHVHVDATVLRLTSNHQVSDKRTVDGRSLTVPEIDTILADMRLTYPDEVAAAQAFARRIAALMGGLCAAFAAEK